jgi:hypothetical protein
MSLLSLLKILHLWGLVMGFGGAVLADLLVLRQAVLRPVRRATVAAVRRLSHIVFAGLALLWASGLALVAVRAMADSHFLMNQKLWAKAAIVVVLTVNGFAIHRFALPALARRRGRRLFDATGPAAIAALCLMAAVSSVSWFMPFVLGAAAELNFRTPALLIVAVYGSLIAAAWVALCGLAFGLAGYSASRPPPPATAAALRRRREARAAKFGLSRLPETASAG